MITQMSMKVESWVPSMIGDDSEECRLGAAQPLLLEGGLASPIDAPVARSRS